MAAFAKKLKILRAVKGINADVPRSVFVGRDYEESVEEESGEEDDPELDSMSVAEEVAPVAQSSRSMPFFSRKKKDASAQGSSQIGSRRSSFMSLGGGGRRLTNKLFRKTSYDPRQPTASKAEPVRSQRQTKKQVSLQPATRSRDSAPVDISQAGRASNVDEDLTGRLAAFEHGTFELEQELQGLDEHGIDELRGKLAAAKQECSEKIKRLLHQHYPAFISASKGIRAMDGEMQALRALLNRENLLLSSVREIAEPQGSRFADGGQQAVGERSPWTRSWEDSPEGVRWHTALQNLDIAIAERRPEDALPLLKQAEKTLLPGQKSGLYSYSWGAGPDVKTEQQARELALRRSLLSDLVTSQMAESACGSYQMQVATQVLASLSGRAHAMKKHLEVHTDQLRKSVNQLLKPQSAGGDADGTEFANALAQLVFGAIGAAAEDVTHIFGKELKDLASLFLVWALSETERCALLLKRHALSPFAAPAGLGPTVACCLLADIHCSALQSSHGLRLSPRLMRDLWPSCDQVLQRRLKRITDDLKRALVTEVEALLQHGLPQPSAAGGWSDLMQVFPSANLLLDELEAVVKILVPFAGPRVREAMSHACAKLFREYTNAVTAQFSHYRDSQGALPQVLDDAIEPALEVAHSMVEQFLPEMAEPLRQRCREVCPPKALYAQLNTFQDELLPPEEAESAADPDAEEAASAGQEAAQWSDKESASEEEEEGAVVNGSAGSKLHADWRQFRLQSKPTEEDLSAALAEEDFLPGRKSTPAAAEVPQPTAAKIARLGQIMGEEEGTGLQTVAPVSHQVPKQDVQNPFELAADMDHLQRMSDTFDELDDLEEMNEELSDIDEEEMTAHQTRRR